MVSSAANAITEGDTQGYVWRFQMKATDWGIVIGRAVQRLDFKTIGIMGLQNAFVLPIMKVGRGADEGRRPQRDRIR